MVVVGGGGGGVGEWGGGGGESLNITCTVYLEKSHLI